MKWYAQENGSALVVALVIVTVILSLGLGVMRFADVTQRKSGDERIRETAFNLTEAVLNNQALLVSNRWPGMASSAYPSSCANGSTLSGCPSTTALTQSFAGTDFAFGASWTVTVRDDLGTTSTYYTKSTLDSTACNGMLPCTWDSNGNGFVWVRAQGTIAGRARTLIALVRQSQKRVAPPRSVIVAGKFTITNTGRKTVVDEKGCQAKNKPAATCNTTEPAPIVVRCTLSGPAPTSTDPCLGYRAEQVAPNNYQTGYTSPVFDTSTLDNMRAYAKQAGSYYNGTCPGVSALTGSLVFVEGASCSYNGGAANSAASPGVLVVNQGTLSLGGNFSYYGLIYMANNLPSPQNAGNLVMLSGTAYVQGAIQVEGSGGVSAGSSGLNISFDPNAIVSFPVAGGGVALAPNSIRELPQSQ